MKLSSKLVFALWTELFAAMWAAPVPTTTILPTATADETVFHVVRVNGSIGDDGEEKLCRNEATRGDTSVLVRSIGATPWSVNQDSVTSAGICPEPLQSLCDTEDGSYISPFFEGDIVLRRSDRNMIEESIAAQKEERELAKARRKLKEGVVSDNDVTDTEVVDNQPEVTHNVPDSRPPVVYPGSNNRQVVIQSSRTGAGTQVHWTRPVVQTGGGSRVYTTGTGYVPQGRVYQTGGHSRTGSTGGRVSTGGYTRTGSTGGRVYTSSRTTTYTSARTGSRSKRALVKPKEFRWENGVIPYTIDANLPEDYKTIIRMGMKHWERRTCVDFVEKQEKHKDYVRFAFYPGCWSYIGKQGGEQILSVGFSCNTMRTVVHEIGHAVGLWHEQSRRDRDKYIKIIKSNIARGAEENFEKVDVANITSLGIAYDFDSVMHYDGVAFTKNGAPTIKVRKEYREIPETDLGMKDRLSDIDIAQVKAMYECNQRKGVEEECFESEAGDGREYRGEIDYTEDFITCQKWSATWPHTHEQYSSKARKNERYGLGEHNFCRNPEGKRSKPWCFTNHKKIRWQYCPVTIC